jgi:hypothetical protein
MKRLKESFRKNGMNYNLLRREVKKAIYSVAVGNHIIGYEVFKIRIREQRYSTKLNADIPTHESYPNNESFGKTAWMCKTFEAAIKKYNIL